MATNIFLSLVFVELNQIKVVPCYKPRQWISVIILDPDVHPGSTKMNMCLAHLLFVIQHCVMYCITSALTSNLKKELYFYMLIFSGSSWILSTPLDIDWPKQSTAPLCIVFQWSSLCMETCKILLETFFVRGRLHSGMREQGSGKCTLYRPYVGSLLL